MYDIVTSNKMILQKLFILLISQILLTQTYLVDQFIWMWIKFKINYKKTKELGEFN